MKALLPGATIGVLGGGQLARMLALEARRMGYRTVVLDADATCSASRVADVHLRAGFDDAAALAELARLSDVVTLDTEHVPIAALRTLEASLAVHPSSRVMEVVQDRLLQREALARHGFPQVRHASVFDETTLRAAAQRVGTDGVLKTRRNGYDGKGQVRVTSEEGLRAGFLKLDAPAVLEAFVPFVAEASVVVARGPSGQKQSFPVSENVHEDHILSYSVVPARLSADIQARACSLAEAVAEGLGVIGLCTVELFVTPEGDLLVNEIAPRSHNSGHYTWGAASVSQFEQQLRAVCGLPLEVPRLLSPVVMLNLLGDLWTPEAPCWEQLLAVPGTRLHLYGKAPRPGRKMGHVLHLGEGDAEGRVLALRRALRASG